MATNIGDIRTKVAGADGLTGRLQDAVGRLGIAVGGPVDQAINNATEEYSKLKPLEASVKVAGDGSPRIAIASLTGFVDQFSEVRDLYYPYYATVPLLRQYPLPTNVWALERLDTGLVLASLYTFEVGQFSLVTFTKPHTVNVSTSTVPASDDEALADLSTHYACLALADYYSQSTDATINADVDDRRGKADLYRSDAEKWRAAWRRKMGLDPAETLRKPQMESRPMLRA